MLQELSIKKGHTIVYSDDTIKYITTPFTLKNKKSKCNFFILQEDNTPNKLIIFDNEKHLEVNIITPHDQIINENTNINKINDKQELPIEVLASSFKFEKDRISIDIKNNIDFYKIDIENKFYNKVIESLDDIIILLLIFYQWNNYIVWIFC